MTAVEHVPGEAPPRSVSEATLVELAVDDLGIIEHARLLFGPGMTALTGETGAGKTLLVGAIDLLLGGRADPSMVRTGAAEAVVEGRFALGQDDLVLTRVVPAEGRSRAYVDGRLATAATLAERAAELVDLHGQNAHQSLLSTPVQREALDRSAGVDLGPLRDAHEERRRIADALAGLGGDAGARAREADLLRYQLAELDAAALTAPDEDDVLVAEEDVLADTAAHREAAAASTEHLAADGAAADLVGSALAAVDRRAPFAAVADRLRSVHAELGDLAAEVRAIGEAIEDRPERLDELRGRRQLLVELRRKYGTAPLPDRPDEHGIGTLADVISFHRAAQARIDDVAGHDARAAQLEGDLRRAEQDVAAAAAVVGRTRRSAARGLAAAVEAHLRELAMPAARMEVRVGEEDPGDDVTFLLAANRGAAPAPLAKVASGGELARSMLALRLVLSAAPPVLVFDEVDAGIGGQAALAVGRSLAALGADHQVLVVTHLPQVAAFADAQVRVAKEARDGATVATAAVLDGAERVVELSRMLAGTPDSERVQGAASELLARAAEERGR